MLDPMLRSVRALLDLRGLTHMVAGGYARDKYYGITPCDADVFIRVPMSCEAECFDIMSKFCETLSVLHLSSAVLQAYDESSSDFDKRIIGLIKVEGVIDLIFMRDPSVHPCDTFDFNVNQFYLNEADEPVHLYGVPEKLKALREDLSMNRILYMEQKWEKMNGR